MAGMAARTTVSSPDTRARLLEAGGQVFSETGYRAATVREIVRRAGANVAAVNYHFRDKEGLYAAVLEDAARRAVEQYPPYGGLPADAPAEAKLRAFVRSFLQRIFDRGHQAVHGKLMAHEMIEPTAALDSLVEQMIRPMYGRLCAVVKTLAGPRATLAQVEASAKSIVGQCLFYKHCSPVIARLEGCLPDERDVDALADHIVSFSLEGLRGLGASRKKGGRR